MAMTLRSAGPQADRHADHVLDVVRSGCHDLANIGGFRWNRTGRSGDQKPADLIAALTVEIIWF